MYPVVAAVSDVALAARLSAVGRSSAPLLGALVSRLRAMGHTVGSKIDDLISWAKQSPANAAVTALTLGSLGVTVADMFETEEGRALASKAELGQLSLADYAKIDAAGAKSEELDLQIAENQIDAHTAIEILRFARGFFGSTQNAIHGHRMLQAFMEMPRNDVIAGYDTLRV